MKFSPRLSSVKSVVPVPEIQMEWDEASCGQLVWLYNEAISHITPGVPNRTPMRSPDRIASLNPASSPDARVARGID